MAWPRQPAPAERRPAALADPELVDEQVPGRVELIVTHSYGKGDQIARVVRRHPRSLVDDFAVDSGPRRPPRRQGCNAAVTSSCGALPSRLLRTGRSPQWGTVDQATGTLYVPNADDGTISVLDGASCNATVSGGCS